MISNAFAGLQNAVWMMGGVPEEHRTDSLSAAFLGRFRRVRHVRLTRHTLWYLIDSILNIRIKCSISVT